LCCVVLCCVVLCCVVLCCVVLCCVVLCCVLCCGALCCHVVLRSVLSDVSLHDTVALSAYITAMPWDRWVALSAPERRVRARGGATLRTLADRAAAVLDELHKALAAALASPFVVAAPSLFTHVLKVRPHGVSCDGACDDIDTCLRVGRRCRCASRCTSVRRTVDCRGTSSDPS
jgi:hypothetical protein